MAQWMGAGRRGRARGSIGQAGRSGADEVATSSMCRAGFSVGGGA